MEEFDLEHMGQEDQQMKHSNMINNKNKNNKNNNNLLIQLGTPQFLLSLIMLTEQYHKSFVNTQGGKLLY
jgi:hypothetical protein